MSRPECIPEWQLKALQEGTLASESALAARAHLNQCSLCRARWERLQAAAEQPPPADLNSLNTTCSLDPEVTENFQHDTRGLLELLEHSNSADSLGKLQEYEILSVLGQGGYGIVFEAHDPVLDRRVAIKALPRELATHPTSRRRFLREARAAAAINHPNVVTIFGVDETHDFPFLVMELLRGKSLRERLRREPKLSFIDILLISSQIAQGLAAAHAQGIIHRDVKPGNIMLVDDLPRIKLTDFGLARAVIEDVNLTSRGMAVGTPGYMSPEQVRGEELDTRSDLFALGCVIYAMFTGHSPFHGRTVLEIARRVDAHEPRHLREIDKAFPEFMDAVVHRLLMKNPEDRYQSAAEVADVLNRHLALLNQTPTDRLPAAMHLPLMELRKPAEKRPLLLAALLFVVIASVAGAAAGFRNFFARLGPDKASDRADYGASVNPLAFEGRMGPGATRAPTSAPDAKPATRSATPVGERRREVSVAQHEDADCRSLGEAFQLVAPGGTIRILDSAEYHEALVLDDAEHLTGVRVEASQGARLSAPTGPALLSIRSIPGLVLTGLGLVVPQSQIGIEVLGDSPGLRLEDVTIQRTTGTSGANGFYAAVVVRGAGSLEKPIVVRRVAIQDTVVGIAVGTERRDSPATEHVLVEACRVQGLNAEDVTHLALLRNCRELVVRRNIFHQGRWGLNLLTEGSSHPDRCLIENNTWFRVGTWITAAEAMPPQMNLRIQGCLVIDSRDVTPAAREMLGRAGCQFLKNVAVTTSGSTPGALAPFALDVPRFPFVSLDPQSPDFLRPDFAQLAGQTPPLDTIPGAITPSP